MAAKDLTILGSVKGVVALHPDRFVQARAMYAIPGNVANAVIRLAKQEYNLFKNFQSDLENMTFSESKKYWKHIYPCLYFKSQYDRILIDKHHQFQRIFSTFVGKPLVITIAPYHKQRSQAQNRYLHGVVVKSVQIWAKETYGEEYSIEEIKAFIYRNVLGNKQMEKDILGEVVTVEEGKHFSDMTTKEFEQAVEHVRLWFGERGCEIPEPTQDNFLTDFLNKLREQ